LTHKSYNENQDIFKIGYILIAMIMVGLMGAGALALGQEENASENLQLELELRSVLDCYDYTRCEMLFTGSGFGIISTDHEGLEDQTIFDFMGLSEAKQLVEVNQK
jgi:hypothetical protein